MSNVSWLPNTPFEICDPEGDWREVSGVYVFAGRSRSHAGSPQWHAYYVGQTRNFDSRLPTHEKWPEAKRLGATHIHARIAESLPERKSLEKRLIEKYRPVLNVQDRS